MEKETDFRYYYKGGKYVNKISPDMIALVSIKNKKEVFTINRAAKDCYSKMLFDILNEYKHLGKRYLHYKNRAELLEKAIPRFLSKYH